MPPELPQIQPPPSRRTTNSAARLVAGVFAAGIGPDPVRTVDQWAEAERVVEETQPYPGPWRNARVPYLVEPMRVASLSHPARRVTFLSSAQTAKTQLVLNLLGQVICETPAEVLAVLPSIDEALNWTKDKLEPMIAASPAVRRRVRDITSRSSRGSTTKRKVFPGGLIELTGANSSKGLQSRTRRVVVFDEISEFPRDVDNRGDPVQMAEARTTAWVRRGYKIIAVSTPGIRGQCRITERWEASSGGRFLVPCPHCDARQELDFANLDSEPGRPETARYHCAECGAAIDYAQQAEMVGRGAWVHERPELVDLHAGYRLNALYSPFVSWSWIAARRDESVKDPSTAKVFTQQVRGVAWDEAHDLPKADILLTRRDRWPPGQVPPSVLFLIGSTDVQGDRLVWAVWGFDAHFGQWLIDTGTLEGDPTLPAVWRAHDALLARRWRDAWGKEIGPDVWGIDSGYLSQHVYAYTYRHAGRVEPEIRALDGRDGWKLPPIGTPKTIDVDWQGRKLGAVRLWPVGTWDLKSELASALRLTELGPGPDGWPPGAIRFNEIVDRGWLDELLSEHCLVDPRTGARRWKKVNTRNEAWDLAVYARAIARAATIRFSDADWQNLAAARQGEPEAAQQDLADLWAPDLKAKAEAAAREKATPLAAPPAAPPPPPSYVPRPRAGWITGHSIRF